jgi:S1-C subfamily serine protease
VEKRSIFVFTLLSCLATGFQMSFADSYNDIPTAAPIDTDSAGRAGDVATQSVIRLVCVDQNTVGTGFLHKSGNIITADHVVRNCNNIVIILPDGKRGPATIIAADQDHDLALIKPSVAIGASPLVLAKSSDFKIGTQVSTWGFPGGYFGLAPLLSVGYLAGIEANQIRPGTIVRQWVVNAAFNGGNSGGPLIHIESGAVFGVVSSKLAPISREANEVLHLLETTNTGVGYNFTKPDGSSGHVMEAQLVAKVLDELRRQVQLVIGKAVMLEDMKAFLTANNIEP